MLSRKQIIAITIGLLIGMVVAAGVLALIVGVTSPLYLPTLISASVLLAVVVVFTQKTGKKK